MRKRLRIRYSDLKKSIDKTFDYKFFYRTVFWFSVFGVLALIVDFGYTQDILLQRALNTYYFVVLIMGVVAVFTRYISTPSLVFRKAFIFDAITVVYTLVVFFIHFFGHNIPPESKLVYLYNDNWIKFAVIFTFIREFSDIKLNYKRTFLNPAQLFITSFLMIILVGTFILMLPKATYNGINFIDALFTSTSAVCVTGLAVVDTGTYFTQFGQTIILILIQIGGLGILTFASYFSYFFKGGATYENQLVLSDLTNSQKISDVFSTLKQIIIITFAFEFISAVFIYLSLDASGFPDLGDEIYFSVFHAVSAFCNAGFSTLSQSLYQADFKYNYFLQLAVIFAFVMGGLGFPIIANMLSYTKYKIKNLFTFKKYKLNYRPWVLSINSRITLITTISLTLIGFIFIYFLEFHNTLGKHHGFGKIVVALFEATTPRTAGFNNVDMTQLTFPTLMIIFLLMWIGASPASTGGGIKTSTFAIAVLNIWSIAKGKSRIEVFRREIAPLSIQRAFAIIALSLSMIGLGITLISIFEKGKSLIEIAFECFSAYSTVGLSLGITPDLSEASKLVLIFMMFIGRVSMLSIIIAVFKKEQYKNYRYPTEEVIMN